MANTGPHAHRFQFIALGLIVLGGAAICGSTIGASTTHAPVSQLKSAKRAAISNAASITAIVSQFQSFAESQSANGSVLDVQYVVSANGSSVEAAISGDTEDLSSNPVVALMATGNFVASAAKVPPGAADPTGAVITEIVDEDTGAVEGWGVSDSVPDLSTFGTVQAVK